MSAERSQNTPDNSKEHVVGYRSLNTIPFPHTVDAIPHIKVCPVSDCPVSWSQTLGHLGHVSSCVYCTACSLGRAGKQLERAAGRSYSLCKPRLWFHDGVSFTITRFAFNTWTRLRAFRPSAPLFLSITSFIFILLIIFSIWPFPGPFPPSLAPRSWHRPVTHVGTHCRAPCFRQGHWYTESVGWQGYFWELVNMRTSFPKVYLLSHRIISNKEKIYSHFFYTAFTQWHMTLYT